MILEVCLAGIESAVAAQIGGAGRIELCDNLAEGGTTPSYGAIALVRQHISIPLHVMIRPRGGDFCYTDREFEVMRQDVHTAVSLGADGLVFGLLTPEGHIDIPRTQLLIAAARPLAVTFHRAFDVAADPFAAFADLLALGVDRLLTSGQQATAWQGRALIKALQTRANGRLHIMAGSGINATNAAALIAATGITEIHVGSSATEQITPSPAVAMGAGAAIAEQHISRVSTDRVRHLIAAVAYHRPPDENL